MKPHSSWCSWLHGRSRRSFLARAAVLASLPSHPADAFVPQDAPAFRLKLAMGLRDLSEETFLFLRQLGVEYAVMPSGYTTQTVKRDLVPAPQFGPKPGAVLRPWDAGELLRIKQRIISFGLKPEAVHLSPFHRVLHGRPGQDDELESVKTSIRAAGQAGIPVVEYNFTPLRASEGYSRTVGRGKAGLRDFDHARVEHLPPLDNVGTYTRERMWERLTAFLRETVPVAEAAGVRLAAHPNDPPVPVFRGAAQPLATLADLKRLITVVDSPSNGITLDTGVLTEMGEDAVAAIRYFGSRDRINHVHFRNVRVQAPYLKYVETFHDEGDCDMPACMRAFQQVRYPRLLIPDHTPEFAGDTADSRMGWAFAFGYLHALRQAAEASPEARSGQPVRLRW